MADETFANTGINQTVVEWGPGGPTDIKVVKANGTDLLNAMTVTRVGETAGTEDVDLAGATEYPAGIIIGTVTIKLSTGIPRALDTANEDNESLVMAPRNSGHTVIGKYQATGATMKAGTKLVPGSEAGKLAPFSYTDTAEATDTMKLVAGELAEDVTQDNTNDQLVKVRLVG